MCVDIRIDMCVDIDITATYPLCMDMWVHARMHEGKEEYRDDRAGLCRLDTWHPIAVWHGRVAWRCAMAVRHGCVRACVRTRACAREDNPASLCTGMRIDMRGRNHCSLRVTKKNYCSMRVTKKNHCGMRVTKHTAQNSKAHDALGVCGPACAEG